MMKIGKLFSKCRPTKSGGGVPIQEHEYCQIASGFRRCGWLFLNSETVKKQNFYLNDAAYPLEGTAQICSMLEERHQA